MADSDFSLPDDDAAARRRELGGFLRARRAEVPRTRYALPPGGRGRTVGLRREEIAVLAGVSVTWYTWLEQGRPINPSRQVLTAVGEVLGLSPAERAYVFELAGYAGGAALAAGGALGGEMSPGLQQLLEALHPNPAFVLAADWSIIGWNGGYAALFPQILDLPLGERNLLRLVFTSDEVRAMLPNWERDSRRFLGDFRAEGAARLGAGPVADLIADLQRSSPHFAKAWREHELVGFADGRRVFHHREVGELVFEHHRLTPAVSPELNLIVYLPDPTGPTAQRLLGLVGRG